MEKIKYPFDWFVTLLGAGGVVVIFIIAVVGNPTHPQILEFTSIFFIGFLFFLSSAFDTYGTLDQKKKIISRTNYFFFTKRLKLEDIKTINYRSTWIMGGIANSVYIIGTFEGKEIVIEFPNVGWRENTLGKMVNDMRKLNPSIPLDDSAKELLKKYSNHD